MNQTFIYDSILLSEEDYKFYQDLPTQNKILFLYDLCLEVEQQELNEHIDESEIFTPKLIKELEGHSRNGLYVHVLILDEIIIFSGNNTDSVINTKKLFFSDGFIFMSCKVNYPDINEHVEKLSTFFKFIEVHDLISYSLPMSLN